MIGRNTICGAERNKMAWRLLPRPVYDCYDWLLLHDFHMQVLETRMETAIEWLNSKEGGDIGALARPHREVPDQHMLLSASEDRVEHGAEEGGGYAQAIHRICTG